MAKRIELTKFAKRNDLRSLLLILAHVALVLVPVYLAVLGGLGWYWIALWIWFGLLMNGLLNLMHECAHYHVFQERSGSDVLGRWVLGPLAFTDFDSYRSRHWKHHTHLGVDGDTKDAYLVSIHGFRLVAFFLRCLALGEALRKFRHQTVEGESQFLQPSNSVVWLLRTALFQGVFFASLLFVAGPAAGRPWEVAFTYAVLAYGLVYAYGLASLTVFAATLRAVAEHQVESGQFSNGRAALRNFHCGAVSRLLFGAYGFAEHQTHHTEPGLPYYHLPEATNLLASDDLTFRPDRGYFGQLARLAKQKPSLQGSDQGATAATSSGTAS